jgi:hypothetical protein
VAQVVELLPSKQEALRLKEKVLSRIFKIISKNLESQDQQGVVVHAYNLSYLMGRDHRQKVRQTSRHGGE